MMKEKNGWIESYKLKKKMLIRLLNKYLKELKKKKNEYI